MDQSQAGFTLIELIIVIVIIGILAAVAIPRFSDQTSQARVAALSGLSGALSSAAMLAQAEYRAEGNSSNSTATGITMNGQTVVVVAGTGSPAATAAGITAALSSNMSGFTGSYSGTNATYNFSSGTITNCNVVYSQTTGISQVNQSGC